MLALATLLTRILGKRWFHYTSSCSHSDCEHFIRVRRCLGLDI